MINTLNLIISAGFLAILYGYIVGKQILSASPGNQKMQEIAAAIQEGARAYLNRQYKTIAVVGIIILLIITYALGIIYEECGNLSIRLSKANLGLIFRFKWVSKEEISFIVLIISGTDRLVAILFKVSFRDMLATSLVLPVLTRSTSLHKVNHTSNASFPESLLF